jgi:hypothetical protein
VGRAYYFVVLLCYELSSTHCPSTFSATPFSIGQQSYSRTALLRNFQILAFSKQIVPPPRSRCGSCRLMSPIHTIPGSPFTLTTSFDCSLREFHLWFGSLPSCHWWTFITISDGFSQLDDRVFPPPLSQLCTKRLFRRVGATRSAYKSELTGSWKGRNWHKHQRVNLYQIDDVSGN